MYRRRGKLAIYNNIWTRKNAVKLCNKGLHGVYCLFRLSLVGADPTLHREGDFGILLSLVAMREQLNFEPAAEPRYTAVVGVGLPEKGK